MNYVNETLENYFVKQARKKAARLDTIVEEEVSENQILIELN